MIEVPRKRVPGYVPEPRSWGTLHRVRVEGDKSRRITIPVGPGHDEFWEHYYAARAGEKIERPEQKPEPKNPRDFRAMVEGYLAHLEVQVETGARSHKTLKQRRSLLRRVCDMKGQTEGRLIGDYHPELPASALYHIADQWGTRTAQFDNSMKALRQAYEWAQKRGWLATNPARQVDKMHEAGSGTAPWTSADMKQFLEAHPEGSAARMWLILAACTGARRDDLCRLGRGHERKAGGVTLLEWQPRKKGSKFVSITMLPQLFEETRNATVIGETYILNAHGRPFKNGDTLGMRVQRWTAEAKLPNRSSHGLRKSLAELLAESGASEHQIMSVLAHSDPNTSRTYTEKADRSRLAASAMDAISGFRIG